MSSLLRGRASPRDPEPEETPLTASKSAPVLGAAAAIADRHVHRRGGPHWGLWLPLLAIVALVVLLRSTDVAPTAHAGFVRVQGTQFMLDCRPFYIAGFNVDNIATAALPGMARKLAGGAGGAALVRGVMEAAAAAGLNVVRTFAFTTDPSFPLQVKPGQYDEDAFRGLDLVVAEAERAGLRVVLVLADNWKYYGGADEYVDWSPSAPARDPAFPPANRLGDESVEDYSAERLKYENTRKALFFTDQGARRLYKDHVRAVLERRNSVTGRQYRSDPTILAYDLLNEPRCSAYETPKCTDLVNAWVLHMAQHLKSLAPSALVAVGGEGFWGERDAYKAMNPGAAGGSDWASKTGQDWFHNANLPQIDFAAFHLWPNNWAVAGNDTFTAQWIDKHTEDCEKMLKKPCLLSEYGHALGTRGLDPPAGIVASQRDPAFTQVLRAVEAALAGGRPLAGSMYWRWGLSVYKNDVPGIYGVLPEHSTFKLVSEHARRVRALMLSQPPGPECGGDCWVPAESVFGLLRRCEHRPSVCVDARSRRQYSKSAELQEGRLIAHGREIYASQAECCRPGLGGFAHGCSTTWF